MMNLSSAAMIVNGDLHGSEATFTSVSSDSRAVQPEGLFVAIPGENLDGHKYISQAGENGAVAAMVSEYSDQTLPQIEVKDTTIALGQLAASWRARFELPIIAITGSNGVDARINMTSICDCQRRKISRSKNALAVRIGIDECGPNFTRLTFFDRRE